MIDYMKRVPHRARTAKRPTRSCRRKTNWRPSAWRSAPAGRARVRMTATAGPGISLMSEFVGLGYYAEDPGGDLRRRARRALAPACRRAPRRATCCPPRFSRTATPSTSMLLPVLARRVLRDGDRGVRFRRAVPDAGVRDDGSRSGHEQLDVGSVPVSGEADRPRQGADARKIWTSSADSRVTRTWTAMASATARCPAPTIRRRLTSRAAAATTKRRNTREREDDYINNMDRLAHKFETMRKRTCRSR